LPQLLKSALEVCWCMSHSQVHTA